MLNLSTQVKDRESPLLIIGLQKLIKTVRVQYGILKYQKQRKYQNLVETPDKLIDEIGENENHELSPVMETIGDPIENYEDKNYKINHGTPIDSLKYLMQ